MGQVTAKTRTAERQQGDGKTIVAAHKALEARNRANAAEKRELTSLRFRIAKSGDKENWKAVLLTLDEDCVNDRDIDGKTLIMVAAMQGNLDVVKKLAEFGAHKGLIDNYERSALAYAIRGGHSETAQWLFENTNWKHDLYLAVRDKWVGGIRKFRELGATQEDVDAAEAKCDPNRGSPVAHRVRWIGDASEMVQELELLPVSRQKTPATPSKPPESGGEESHLKRRNHEFIGEFVC